MFKTVTALAALACAALAAQAQTPAPGLWEHSFSMKSANGEMERAQAQLQQQLAAMPPAQRKQIEDMMASRGVHMNAQGVTTQVCLTKEQAAKPVEPRLAGDCKQTSLERSAGTMSYKFTCTSPRQASGEGKISYASDKAYSGTGSVTTQIDGKPQQMNMAMSGKWLGTECGDVKPIGAMPTK
jgi:uncharacterized membrane protein YkoI